MMGKAIEASGDVEKSRAVYLELIEKYPRQEVAARAQFTIAAHYDELGDLERAVAEYDLVKEQGTGHPASQEAAARQVEIQRVLDLRAELASDNVEEVERKRFLLAEQLLEEIGDAEGAAAEYGALAVDAFGTEWGARALLASAWVFEHRLDRPDTANALLFRLANGYSSTEADEVARRRLGYPVWRVEQLDPGPVEFIRPEGSEEGPEEIFVQRVEPRNVPLPEGETNVEVWIRLGLNPDGTVRSTKIVRSAGEAFDDAVVEAAQASTFVGPNAGGPEFTVQKYAFPPVLAASTEPAPAASTNGRSATPLGVGDEPPDALAPPSSMPFEPGKYDSTTNPESLFSTPATDSSATSASSDSSDSSAAADSSIPGFRGNGTQTPD
jgi:TonB family protein